MSRNLRSTNVAIAERCPAPTSKSPSQCPACRREATEDGRWWIELHGRGLLECTVAGSASATAVPIGASGAQVLPIDWDDQAAVDRLIDGLGTHMPQTSPPVTAPQPPADLGRGPVLCELAGHDLRQLGINSESAWLGSSAPLVGPVVRLPRLVATIGLAVAGDLSVDALKGLSDPCRDQLDRLTPGEPHQRSRSDHPGTGSAG